MQPSLPSLRFLAEISLQQKMYAVDGSYEPYDCFCVSGNRICHSLGVSEQGLLLSNSILRSSCSCSIHVYSSFARSVRLQRMFRDRHCVSDV